MWKDDKKDIRRIFFMIVLLASTDHLSGICVLCVTFNIQCAWYAMYAGFFIFLFDLALSTLTFFLVINSSSFFWIRQPFFFFFFFLWFVVSSFVRCIYCIIRFVQHAGYFSIACSCSIIQRIFFFLTHFCNLELAYIFFCSFIWFDLLLPFLRDSRRTSHTVPLVVYTLQMSIIGSIFRSSSHIDACCTLSLASVGINQIRNNLPASQYNNNNIWNETWKMKEWRDNRKNWKCIKWKFISTKILITAHTA